MAGLTKSAYCTYFSSTLSFLEQSAHYLTTFSLKNVFEQICSPLREKKYNKNQLKINLLNNTKISMLEIEIHK